LPEVLRRATPDTLTFPGGWLRFARVAPLRDPPTGPGCRAARHPAGPPGPRTGTPAGPAVADL